MKRSNPNEAEMQKESTYWIRARENTNGHRGATSQTQRSICFSRMPSSVLLQSSIFNVTMQRHASAIHPIGRAAWHVSQNLGLEGEKKPNNCCVYLLQLHRRWTCSSRAYLKRGWRWCAVALAALLWRFWPTSLCFTSKKNKTRCTWTKWQL